MPIMLANVFTLQRNQDEYILLIGQISPPILVGSQDEQRRQLQELGTLSVRPIARIGFTQARLRELVGILESSLIPSDSLDEGKQHDS